MKAEFKYGSLQITITDTMIKMQVPSLNEISTAPETYLKYMRLLWPMQVEYTPLSLRAEVRFSSTLPSF
jgi:hypothetical protein